MFRRPRQRGDYCTPFLEADIPVERPSVTVTSTEHAVDSILRTMDTRDIGGARINSIGSTFDTVTGNDIYLSTSTSFSAGDL